MPRKPAASAKPSRVQHDADGSAFVLCVKSGRPVPYSGSGRPPKYHPDVKRDMEREKRRARYDARQAKAGKTVKRRGADGGVSAAA